MTRLRSAEENRRIIRRFMVVRGFDPGELRDDHGKWTDGPGGGSASTLKDALKLAGKIDLEPDERLVGSAKLDGGAGGVRMALTELNGKRMLRLGLGSEGYGQRNRDEGLSAWDGNPSREPLPKAEQKRLETEFADLGAEFDSASPARQEQIDARQNDIRDQLGATDAGFNGTAQLDQYSTRRLIDRISPALAEAIDQEKTENAAWDEINALEARGNPDPARMAALRERARADSMEGIIFTQGIIPGSAWGDVHFTVELDDPSVGPFVTLGVKPKGTSDNWGDDKDWMGRFDAAEWRKISRLLDKLSAGNAAGN